MAPIIRASPSDSMFDSHDLRLSVDGLRSGQSISVICLLNPIYEDNDKFVSMAHFVADGNGRVDLRRDKSIGGSYEGVDGMGLLWSLVASKKTVGAAFVPRDVTEFVVYHFYAVDGHISQPMDVDFERQYLCHTMCNRHLLHPDVERKVVEVGRLRGTIFVPKAATAQRPCSATIDLYGTRGGLGEVRACLMASHGYACLALAYFRYKDLPKSLDSDKLDMEYFLEAIDWLLSLPYIRKDGVAMVGASLGADLGILTACISKKVKTVISVNGYHMLQEMWRFNYQGQVLPYQKGVFNENFIVDGHVDMGYFRRSLYDDPALMYPVEKSDAHFLFHCGEKDRNTDAMHTGALLMERLRDHGKDRQGEFVVYVGTGHLLEAPYTPMVHLGLNRSYGMLVWFGGELKPHMKGQSDMWKKTFEFMHEHLGAALPMRVLGEEHGSKL